MTTLSVPHHELFRQNGRRWGRLLSDYTIQTPITGYNRTLDTGRFRCTLFSDGRLIVFKWSEWDLGSGDITIQDIAMIVASLPHDAFCHMTGRGILPWSVRRLADNFLAKMLWQYGAKGFISGASTAWRWLVVSANSQLIARFKAQPEPFKTED